MPLTRFIEGPAGVGKTTYAIQHVRDLLDAGARGDEVLVLVPQRALGWPYVRAFTDPTWPSGTSIDVVTLAGDETYFFLHPLACLPRLTLNSMARAY